MDRLVPAAAAVPGYTRDGYDGDEHYSESHRRHDASIRETPQAEHSNVKSSGNPPNRAVRRTSRIGCAHVGQRGGAGGSPLTHSSDIRTFLTSANMTPPYRQRYRLRFQWRMLKKSTSLKRRCRISALI
jgi:hypothetical protein